MSDIILEKSLITSEDLQIGLGKIQQRRQNETIELTEVNASELLGIIVVDTVEQLESLEPENMKVTAVFVQANKCIYTWAETQWVTSNHTVYVVESMVNTSVIPQGYAIVYCIADNKLYYKAGSQWIVNGEYVYVVNSSQDVQLLPAGAKMAITIDTGSLYVQSAGSWNRIKIDIAGDPILIVDTIDELPQVVNNIRTCIVKDRKRGGIFLYDQDYAGENDGGIIFYGWRRQYENKVSVLWYGADNNGVQDSTAAFASAFTNASVIIPAGDYKISNLCVIDNNIDIEAFGATIHFTENGQFQFGYQFDGVATQISQVFAATNQFSLTAVQQYEYGKYCRFTPAAGDITQRFSQHVIANQSQLSKLTNLVGVTCSIGDIFKYSLTNATASIFTALRVNINGLTIQSDASNTCLTFIGVCDSVLTNIYVTSRYSNCLHLENCANFKIDGGVFNNDTEGNYTAVTINGCDNLILDSIIARGTKCGIEFNTQVSNIIGIYSSVIGGTTAIDTNGVVNSLNCVNTQILGKSLLGGYNFSFENCTFTGEYIHLLKFAGGDFICNKCSFVGTSQDIAYNYIKVSNNLLFEDNYKLSNSTRYVITNCSFAGTSTYSGKCLIECIAQGLNKSNIAYYGDVIIDNLFSSVNLDTIAYLYGDFENVKITNIKIASTEVTTIKRSYTAIDLRTLYLQNIKELQKLNLQSAYTRVANFYTDNIIYTTILKTAAEIEGNFSRTFSQSEKGFILNQVLHYRVLDLVIPKACTMTDNGTGYVVNKLKNNDQIGYKMNGPCAVNGINPGDAVTDMRK